VLVTGRATQGGSVLAIGGTMIVLAAVPLPFAVTAWSRRGVRTVRRLACRRAAEMPIRPPIEQLAHDLRRLLWRHDELSRSSDVAHAKWLKALEAAISSRAIKAATALEVPYQDPPPYSGLDTEELRRLLRALAAEGLVLPENAGLLAPGGRH
jgi:hypothetical protein